MMNVHQSRGPSDSQQVIRIISHYSRKAMDREITTCPRCKLRLRPDVVHGENDKEGSHIWWMCTNVEKCMFPIDLPSEVYCVPQTRQQMIDGFIPLPDISKLPIELRSMYPLNFPSTSVVRSQSSCALTCDSGLSGSAEGRSSTDVSSPRSNESSVGARQLDRLNLRNSTPGESSSTVVDDASNVASSSAADEQSSQVSSAADDDLDRDIETSEMDRNREPVRVLKRKHISSETIVRQVVDQLTIEDAPGRLLDMEDSNLLDVVRKATEGMCMKRRPVHFSSKARMSSYRIDQEYEADRQLMLDVDLLQAKNMFDARNVGATSQAIRNATDGYEILSTVGVKTSDSDNRIAQKNAEMKKTKLAVRVEQMLIILGNEFKRRQDADERHRSEEMRAKKSQPVRDDQRAKIDAKAKIMLKARNRVLSKLQNAPRPPVQNVFEQQSVSSAPPQVIEPVVEQHSDILEPYENFVGDFYSQPSVEHHSHYEDAFQPSHDAHSDRGHDLSLNLEGIYDDYDLTHHVAAVSNQSNDDNLQQVQPSFSADSQLDTCNLDNDEFLQDIFGI